MVENKVDGFISIVKNSSGGLNDSERDSFILYSVGKNEFNIYPPIGFRIKSENGMFVVGRNYLYFNEERHFNDLESATEGLWDFINETAGKTRKIYEDLEGLSYLIIGEVKDFGAMQIGELYSNGPSLDSFG